MQSGQTLSVKRWPTEMPLFVLAILISLPVWAMIVISIIGVFYAALFSFIVLVGHFMAIAYLRGSGIKITPEQLPDLYTSVASISQRMGFKNVPEVYILQGNGVLNAMATKFVFTKFIIIYSNLIDACDKDPSACNMIIGHELGHLRAGHLRWSWFIWPTYIIPFFANALSRAREYTADRYGAACCDNTRDALNGLLILAGGKNVAGQIKLERFTDQIKSINTGLMRIGEWMHTHPPLVRRICALDPALNTDSHSNARNSIIKALLMIFITTFIICGSVILGIIYLPNPKTYLADKQQHQEETARTQDLTDTELGLH